MSPIYLNEHNGEKKNFTHAHRLQNALDIRSVLQLVVVNIKYFLVGKINNTLYQIQLKE